MKILLVEDEPKLAQTIKKGIEENGFDVDVALDGMTGKSLALQNKYDLLIFDVIIPHINGIELCKIVRQAKPKVPILLLTALGTTDDKLAGFDSGADDYLVKPFEFKELIARIKSLIRRNTSLDEPNQVLRVANLELNLTEKIAIRDGKKIELTAREFALLEYLMKNRGKVLSRLDVSEHVWDINFDTGTNVIDVYINILRKKIDKEFEPKLIHTRVGMGYVLKEDI
jgi:two-component system, OmpR family, copper resistance phosphate regulon response regulator CusR